MICTITMFGPPTVIKAERGAGWTWQCKCGMLGALNANLGNLVGDAMRHHRVQHGDHYWITYDFDFGGGGFIRTFDQEPIFIDG